VETTLPLRFRSKGPFLWVRGAGVCLVPTLVAAAAIATERAVISTTISILMVVLVLIVIYRLLHACLVVDKTQFVSRGIFRDPFWRTDRIQAEPQKMSQGTAGSESVG
jgi:hypothetical protein